MDPKRIVADGYDQIAETFLAWAQRGSSVVRERYLQALRTQLPDGARVLDLGCGAGVPVARRLAERFDVTGVDISRRQIELARENVPNATFIQANMTALAFPRPASTPWWRSSPSCTCRASSTDHCFRPSLRGCGQVAYCSRRWAEEHVLA